MEVQFLGDISFNNRYEILRGQGRNPFAKIDPLLSSSDFLVGNLECLGYGKDINPRKKPRLGTDPTTFDFLTKLKIGLVTLAHNHVYDNLSEGFAISIKKIESLNIEHIGASLSLQEQYRPHVIQKAGIKVAFLNFVTEDTNPSLPEDHEMYLNFYDPGLINAQITELKKIANFVVILMHWGGRHEGGYYPDKSQRYLAKQLFDKGADLIIGHHSHTVQPFECINGKYVFYSLGNFCFDDIISDQIVKYLSPRRKVGMVLKVNFLEKHYEVKWQLIRNKNLNPTFAPFQHKTCYMLRLQIYRLFKSFSLFYTVVFWANKTLTPKIDFIFYDKSPIKAKAKRLLRKILKSK